MKREPNTQYVLSYSYGKDSGACIHVVKDILGWPLDRIVTADVWATQDIPAVLPEMWDWMQHADEIIYQRYGIRVEHFYATKKAHPQMNVGGGTNTHLMTISTTDRAEASTEMKYSDSQKQLVDGAGNLKLIGSQNGRSKLTYEDIFYRELSPKRKGYKKIADGFYNGISNAKIYGFPMRKGNWCTGELKQSVLNRIQRSFLQAPNRAQI